MNRMLLLLIASCTTIVLHAQGLKQQTIYYSNGKPALQGHWTYYPGTYFPINIRQQLFDPLQDDDRPSGRIINRKWDRLALFTSIRPEGLVAMWNSDGTKFLEIEFKNGVPDGMYRRYADDGWLVEEGTLERGMPKGIWKRYSKNGQINFSGSYLPYTEEELADRWATAYRAVILDKSRRDISAQPQTEPAALNPFNEEPGNAASRDSFIAIQQYTPPFARAEHECYKEAKRDGTFIVTAVTSDMSVVTAYFKDDKRTGEWTNAAPQTKHPTKLGFDQAGNLEYVTGTDGIRLTIGEAVAAWKHKREQEQKQWEAQRNEKVVEKAPSANGPTIFKYVEQMPEFPDKDTGLKAYLARNLRYPADVKQTPYEGRAVVQFIVNEDGRISDAQVVRSAGMKSLDSEALRLVNAMPRWKPGRQQGLAVKVYYTLPVTFKIPD